MHDVIKLVKAMPRNSLCMIGVDLQDCLGPSDLDVFPECVGIWAEGQRGRKGDIVFDAFVCDLGLAAINTIVKTRKLAFTHFCLDGAREPKTN